jgi:hypothetical protein
MELETINKLFLELSQIATATTARELLLKEQIRTLEDQIGYLPDGVHPDERKPRAETWLRERENWQAEVEALRKELDRWRIKPPRII